MEPGGRAFVVTRLGEEGSPERERADSVLDFVIAPAAGAVGLEIDRADLDARPGPITPRIVSGLLAARAIVCDLTGRNPNVYYELGLAHALNLPVVLLIDSHADLPFDIKDEAVIPIGDDGVLGAKQADTAARRLTRALETVLAPDYEPRSTVDELLSRGRSLPAPLRRALDAYATGIALYKHRQRYELLVRDVERDALTAKLRLEYTLVNATQSEQRYQATLTPLRPTRDLCATVGGATMDLEDPDVMTARGLSLPIRLAPNAHVEVTLSAEVTYRVPDTELFLTYLPALDYELAVEHPNDEIELIVESLLPDRAERVEDGPGRIVYCARGIALSYQGVKLDWRRR